MGAGVQMNSPQNANGGLGVKQVMIRAVDPTAGIVYATDTGGIELQMPLRIRRVDIPPVAGQTWLADRSLGFWSLAAFVETADGLWTGPRGNYAVSQTQTATGLTQSLTTTPWSIPTVGFTYANPSPAWSMRVAAWVHARITCNLTANSGAALLNSIQFAGAPMGVRNSYGPLGNPTASTISGLRTSAWNVTEEVVAPGATATLNAMCTAASISSAAVTLTEWTVWVEFIGWLIDPTQPGGVPT